MKKGVTVWLLLSFILGVASGPFFYWHNFYAAIWLIVGLVWLTVVYWRRHIRFALMLLMMTAMLLGNLRFGYSRLNTADDLSSLIGKTVELTGSVSTDPEPKGTLNRLTIQVISIDGKAATGRLLVTVPTRPDYEYGNLLWLSGRVDLPINRGDFDYAGYLSRFGVSTTMNYPAVELIKPFAGNPLLRYLYLLKHQLISTIQSTLPEPAAGLLAGLLFGIKSDLPPSLTDEFNRVGLTHIIALSGFNITIIVAGLLGLFCFLSLRWRYSLIIIAIVLFVLMIGISPSVTRAAIMGILVLWASLTGRLADSGIALLLAATTMLLANPLVLYHDVGFQLSFAATVGIIYLNPIFYDIFRRLPRWLNNLLSPTLGALVFSTPLLIYQFERLSLIAPLSNVLVLPVISTAMGLGFISTLLGLIYPPAGVLFGMLSVWPLRYIVGVATALSRLPAASVEAKISSIWWVVIAYAILGLGLIFKQNRAPKTNLELRPLVAAR
ncbi:MAG: ComEC/Rec2 family competence protein [Patescibacteria group bacterium]|jgi:competence protein ComEC